MNDLKIQLRVLIESLCPEKLQLVYEYASSLKDGPKGNTARCCGMPLARCECDEVVLLCNLADSCDYNIEAGCRHGKRHVEATTDDGDRCDGICHKAEARCIEIVD